MPLSLSRYQIGYGWREVHAEEPLTTLTQSYLPDQDRWVDASFLTKDGYINRGLMNYRKPISRMAHAYAIYTVVPKLFRRYILRRQY